MENYSLKKVVTLQERYSAAIFKVFAWLGSSTAFEASFTLHMVNLKCLVFTRVNRGRWLRKPANFI